MYGWIIRYNKFSGFVKLHFKLLIHKQYIMHFGIKIRISVLTIISYFMWFYVCLVKNRIYCTFMNGGKSCVSSCFSSFINMWGQPCISPGFGSISKINWLLARGVNDPGFFFVCNLSISSTAGSIKECVFNASFFKLFKAEHDAAAVETYFISNRIYWHGIRT